MQLAWLGVFLAIVVVTTVSAWITASRMRRRLKRTLGIHASETELSSIGTWMRVSREEQRNEDVRHPAPKL